MTPAECIRDLAWRCCAEEREALILDEAAIARWPPAVAEATRQHSILRDHSGDGRCVCPGCDDGHIEDVFWFSDASGEQHAAVRCPVYGRVEIDPSVLQRWVLDVESVAHLLAEGLAAEGAVRAIRPGRIWSLGVVRAGPVVREVVLVRGLLWQNGATLQQALGERGALAVTLETSLPEWLDSAVGFAELVSWNGRQFTVDRVLVEARLSATMPAPSASTDSHIFRRDGDGWLIAFGGAPFRMRDLGGLQDIQTLLRRPNQPVPVTEIAGVLLVEAAIPLISPEGLARLRSLCASDDATDRQAEQFLRSVTKLGGGLRSGPNPLSRAASMVSNRITRAIGALQEHDPPLAQHLDRSIRRGIVLSYRADFVPDWET